PKNGCPSARRAGRHSVLAAGAVEKAVGPETVAVRHRRRGCVACRGCGVRVPVARPAGLDGQGGVDGWGGPGPGVCINRRSVESHAVEQTQDYGLRRGADGAGRRWRDWTDLSGDGPATEARGGPGESAAGRRARGTTAGN